MRRPRPLFAVMALAGMLAGCGKSDQPASDGTAAAPAAAPAPLSDAEKASLLASLPAPYNVGDLANGELKFTLCRSCHVTEASPVNLTGPHLHGIFGRKAGALEGFKYSDALKASGITWDAARLDAWIADPHAVVPQTKMVFAGLKDAKDRADMIAYLKVETSR